jgi:hypothetical protein
MLVSWKVLCHGGYEKIGQIVLKTAHNCFQLPIFSMVYQDQFLMRQIRICHLQKQKSHCLHATVLTWGKTVQKIDIFFLTLIYWASGAYN